MLQLYQAEWCPSSHRVRQHLTELGVDFVARQVQVDRGDRRTLLADTGVSSIPVLVTEDGWTVAGEDAIHAYLECRFEETPETAAHRSKAQNWVYAEAAALGVECGFPTAECGCAPMATSEPSPRLAAPWGSRPVRAAPEASAS